MTATYFQKILYMYPDITHVVCWHSRNDGTVFDKNSQEAYDAIEWSYTPIEKPTKEQLDALDDAIVLTELARRSEINRKAGRNEQARTNLTIMSNYDIVKRSNPDLTLTQYLDSLERLAHDTK